MFHLFRKHQKVLLTSIAAIAIGSMAFSAIAPLFIDQNQPSQALKQDLIKDTDKGLLALFNHSFDASSSQIIFPEAIFTSSLIETGVLKAVYHKHKDKINLELDAVFEKIISYDPKEIMPGVRFSDFIAQVSPKLSSVMKDVKEAKNANYEKKLAVLESFFKEKNKWPLALMQQYIYATSKGQTKVDIEDLYYFGLEKPEDFFGSTLVNEAVKSLVVALKPEQDKQSGSHVLQAFSARLDQFYGTHVHPNQFFIALGVSPECGLEALKIFEAIKDLKKQTMQSVLLDPLAYQTFSDYTSGSIEVVKYSLKEDLIPKTMEEVALLEYYSSLKAPLLADEYQVKIRTLDKSKAFRKISKKEIYKEALCEYNKLTELMPYALSKSINSDKEKLEAIKNLSGASKDIFDGHMQKLFIQNDPSFYQKALEKEAFEQKSFYLSSSSKKSPLEGFKTQEMLKKELDLLPINNSVIFDVEGSLYEIELLQKTSLKEPMSYPLALSSGLLKEALKTELESLFKEQIRKNPSLFINSQKKMKSFDEAYSDLIEIKISDLKSKMANSLGVPSEVMGSFLLKGYGKVLLEEKADKEDFRLMKQTETLLRSQAIDSSLKALFKAPLGAKSNVVMDQNGHYIMYKKQGALDMGEKILDKKAINVLADEKLKHLFFERVQSL